MWKNEIVSDSKCVYGENFKEKHIKSETKILIKIKMCKTMNRKR